MKRFGTPFGPKATEAMLMIPQLLRAGMFGKNACMVRNIERQFSPKANNKSVSLASIRLP
jgi:hypothetical protein